jgi:hypothetical protein
MCVCVGGGSLNEKTPIHQNIFKLLQCIKKQTVLTRTYELHYRHRLWQKRLNMLIQNNMQQYPDIILNGCARI